MKVGVQIIEAAAQDMPAVKQLFRDYQQSLNTDLCFQDFEQELASLPGTYSPPKGVILLAAEHERVLGCVGIRPHSDSEAELKRLYVKPEHQGRGIGKQLFRQAMIRAEKTGYASIVLETLPSMRAAKTLYRGYGFEPITSYYETPKPDAEYYRYVFAVPQ